MKSKHYLVWSVFKFVEIDNELDVKICLNLIRSKYGEPLNKNYFLIEINKIIDAEMQYSKFEEWIKPSVFFHYNINGEPNLNLFLAISEKFMERMIELWEEKGYTGDEFKLIKNNYKKYISEAKARDLIL